MTVVMPPRRAPTRAFHNKPYYPDLTVRRSSRLALDATSGRISTRRASPSPPPAKRRRLPADTTLRRNASPATKTPPYSKLRLEVSPPNAVASSSKRKADEDDDHTEGSSSILSRRKKRKENAVVVDKMPAPAHCQVSLFHDLSVCILIHIC